MVHQRTVQNFRRCQKGKQTVSMKLVDLSAPLGFSAPNAPACAPCWWSLDIPVRPECLSIDSGVSLHDTKTGTRVVDISEARWARLSGYPFAAHHIAMESSHMQRVDG